MAMFDFMGEENNRVLTAEEPAVQIYISSTKYILIEKVRMFYLIFTNTEQFKLGD